MKILAIETSCDETACAVLEIKGGLNNPSIKILSNIVSSQVKIHRPFGGVVPNLAKREHQKNLISILTRVLRESKLLKIKNLKLKIKNENSKFKIIKKILEREEILLKKTLIFLKKCEAPKIDLIAVTAGPGLAPALWPGVNFAKSLAYFWRKPILKVNHINGHIVANWFKSDGDRLISERFKILRQRRISAFARLRTGRRLGRKDLRFKIEFPSICLVVSGGHTQIILMKKFGKYKIIGETRDDAAGEAFDKVARILKLGYPGGPVIAAKATSNKQQDTRYKMRLPRPMINSKNLDFSFSGLKTAVLYLMQSLEKESINRKEFLVLRPIICREFQQAAIDVLVFKTIAAAKKYKAQSIMLSGGVAANQELREQLKEAAEKYIPDSTFCVPDFKYCTDNAAMIALSAYFDLICGAKKIMVKSEKDSEKIQANPNWRI